jgi:hypothetical protein
MKQVKKISAQVGKKETQARETLRKAGKKAVACIPL